MARRWRLGQVAEVAARRQAQPHRTADLHNLASLHKKFPVAGIGPARTGDVANCRSYLPTSGRQMKKLRLNSCFALWQPKNVKVDRRKSTIFIILSSSGGLIAFVAKEMNMQYPRAVKARCAGIITFPLKMSILLVFAFL